MFKHAAAGARSRPFVLVLPLTVALLGVSAFAGLQLAAGGSARGANDSPSPGAVSANTEICKSVKQAFAVHLYAGTQSTTFVDITGAAVTFTVSGTTNTCLIVSYTAVAESQDVLIIRALLDGTTPGNPTQRSLTPFHGTWDSGAATFVLTGVAPGNHTLTMQFRSFAGGVAEINNGTLVVGFR